MEINSNNKYIEGSGEFVMERMIEILKKQFKIYEEILKISEEKTDIIVKDKVDELKELVSREEELVKSFIPLEKERLSIVKEFGRSNGITGVPKIPEICDYFPENKDELMSLRKSILDITKKISVRNEQNEKLIKNSLDYINFSVGLITGTGTNPVTYGKYGEANKKEARKFLDISL